MSVLKETNKLINHSLNLTSKLIESDTNVSIIDLNMLENLNTNQSLNYIKLEQNLNQLELNSNHLKQLSMSHLAYTLLDIYLLTNLYRIRI